MAQEGTWRPRIDRPFRGGSVLLALLFGCALICVCLPRFNRQEVLSPRWIPDSRRPAPRASTDATQYAAQVMHFRGEAMHRKLRAPFAYRPLAPFLASRLPLKPMTALNLVNIAALLVALACIDGTIAALGLGASSRLAGAALFTFSFPVFYYGAIGYVDPVAIACISAGVLFIVRQQWWALALVLVIGALTKETTIVLLPAAVARLALGPGTIRRKAAVSVAMLACFAAATVLARGLAPGTGTHLWTPSLAALARNASRPRAWIAFSLSFGLPGVLSSRKLPALLWRRTETTPPALTALAVGCAAVLAVALYSFVAASADGRFLWLLYPFAIPIAVARRS
ncbi:MAG: hypothetical protein MUQ65_03420 [Armatimonadetes bacterium]|nr:hypothetical protein [Armatimonadota bacterium]